MAGDRTVDVRGAAVGSVIVSGDKNRLDATLHTTLTQVTLPPASSVDISQELAQLRVILERIGDNGGKIGRAFDDANEEAQKPQPDKDEIGTALNRAINYAKSGNGFAEEVSKLAPHLVNVVSWLGSEWHQLLGLIGYVA